MRGVGSVERVERVECRVWTFNFTFWTGMVRKNMFEQSLTLAQQGFKAKEIDSSKDCRWTQHDHSRIQNVTKYPGCHDICKLSLPGAALPLAHATPHLSSAALDCACHETWTLEVSRVLHLPLKIFEKLHIAPVTQDDLRHLVTHVKMSRSATPAMQDYITRMFKPPKVTSFAGIANGPAIWSSLRTANGCEQLGTVANGKAASSKNTSTPRPPKLK